MQTHRVLWLSLIAIVLDLVLFYMIGQDPVILTLQTIVLGIAVTVSASWFPAAIHSFREGARTAGDKIVLSVWSAWTVLIFQRIYALMVTVYTVPGPNGQDIRPLWLIESPASTIVTTLICVAGVYAAYATVSEAQIPKQDKTWTLISTAIGSFAAGAFIVFALMNGLQKS